jgi:AcrR family transcriptional regulator
MGIKERRERERQELRQSILSAALGIAGQEGWQAVTMRKVADLIEYRPPVLYDYFGSKEGILQELVREGFEKLLGRVRRAYEETEDTGERMVRLSLVYCEFAWEEKELYQVMHGIGGAACSMDNLPPALVQFGALMRRAVSLAVGKQGDSIGDVDEVMDIHRAMLYGLVALTLEGHLAGGKERAMLLVERATRDWLVTARLRVVSDA